MLEPKTAFRDRFGRLSFRTRLTMNSMNVAARMFICA